jgi:hypothetical protein
MSAWTVIEHVELSGSQADVMLDNIPNTYTDLLLVCSTRQSYGTEAYFGILLNESNSNTNTRVLYGSGSSAASTNYTGAAANLITFSTGSSATASTFGSTMFYIPNYTSSVAKSVSMDGVSENNGGVAYQIIGAGLWNNTAVIDRIKVVSLDTNANLGQTFSQYSSFTLYGILKGSSGGVTVS